MIAHAQAGKGRQVIKLAEYYAAVATERAGYVFYRAVWSGISVKIKI